MMIAGDSRGPTVGPTALFLSSHLDDVAFSCGGAVAALARRDWRVVLATAFTASVPNPTGFALRCQTDKGIDPEVDYLAIRRDEDLEYARRCGIESVEWFDLPEAPHRGYHSARELFGPIAAEDRVGPSLSARLEALIARVSPEVVFAPQGLGDHVDHRQVVIAVRKIDRIAGRILWYRDLPYAARADAPRPDPEASDLPEFGVRLTDGDLLEKLDGCACYASQLPFQFGGEARMRTTLAEVAASDAIHFGTGGFAERFQVAAEVGDRLSAIRSGPNLF